WGKSGGYLYVTDRIYQDDRFRFLQTTAKLRIVRKRIIPQHQVDDLRAALAYLAGEPGVDPARVGIIGKGLGGQHRISVAARDARVKAGVAITSAGVKTEQALPPPADLMTDAIRWARTGAIPDSRLALWEYHPFELLEQIPKATPMLIDAAANDDVAIAW